MSLQSRLARGIAVILAVIVIFMVLTSMSYFDIDGFVTTVLPRHVTIARTYERFADTWNAAFQNAQDHLLLYESVPEKNITGNIDRLHSVSDRLKNLIELPDRQERFSDLNHLCASFTSQLSSYYLQLNNRNRLHRKKFLNRQKATTGMKTEFVTLLDRFKSMLGDFNSALRNPDFQASLGQTSELMEKITRVERDLLLAETEVSLYISQKSGASAQNPDPNLGKKAAQRVENRIRSILYLLENSAQESSNPIQKRVLKQIQNKINSFYQSFQQLRNVLEAPESELIEIEDQLVRRIQALADLTRTGIIKSAEEAEFYWGQIFAISDQIKAHATNNHHIILTFLILVLVAGIYLYFSIPAKIGGPLQALNQQLENFKLGSDIKPIPTANTEEIDSLAQAFVLMGHKLNQQADVNRSYLQSIHGLTQVYRELHQTQKRLDRPNERREKAVDYILDQLITRCPKIDLLKVMEKSKDGKSFTRLGDPVFSERFRNNSQEFAAYCGSVQYNVSDPEKSADEVVPADRSLTGHFFEENCGIKTAIDDNSFFQASYPLTKLSDLPIAANFTHEKGLNGSLLTEPLLLPQEDPEEDQKKLGLLFIYFLEPDTKLSWQDIFFIQIIASQLASIIETDNLLQERDIKRNLDEQLNMAKEIQDNLLPYSIPKVPNLQISKLWKSAAEVGGDFYDFFVLDKNRLGVVIADASGKNVPAAIIMTVFKTTLSTMALDKISADEVLTRANRVIAKNITADRFITAMYVIIDAETGEVELSSAGHNPAFVVSGRGHELALHEKNVSCMPLGIVDSYEYESIRFKLKKNDLLFLYTDGVTEARNADGDEFGLTGLKKYLSRPRSSNPAADLEKVLLEFAKNAGQHDDITAVSLEFKGS